MTSLEEFTKIAYEQFDLNWKDHVDIDENLLRASEIMKSYGNPNSFHKSLGWKSKVTVKRLIQKLINNYRLE